MHAALKNTKWTDKVDHNLINHAQLALSLQN